MIDAQRLNTLLKLCQSNVDRGFNRGAMMMMVVMMMMLKTIDVNGNSVFFCNVFIDLIQAETGCCCFLL